MRFIVLKGYIPVDEVEEFEEYSDVYEDFNIAVKELYSIDNYKFGVNESAFFIIDDERKIYLQRERLVDILGWEKKFPIIGYIIDSLARHKKERILSALVDNTIPRKLFQTEKEFHTIDEIIDEIVSQAKPVKECVCLEKEPPDFIYPPTPLLRAVEFLELKGEPWMCRDGRISVRVTGLMTKKCYTLQEQ